MLAVATAPVLHALFADATIIVDLSQDLPEDASAMASSPGAAAIDDFVSSDPLIRAAIVLENGKVVANYHRDDVNANAPFQVWSTTKSWTSLLVGLLVEGNLLALNETLGDIFQDDTAWMDITDETLAFRKNVTVEELLTMLSGLISPPRRFDGTGGGSSLSDSLSYPNIGPKGDFSYLGMSNILSYVIKERTGLTPRQYLAENVMSHLGISESDYDWLLNADGVEFAFYGLKSTGLQMAKFGQLFLQGGRTGPFDEHRVVSQSWVDDSFTSHSTDSNTGLSYGYLFWGFGPYMYCALGTFGQDICIDQNSGRVVVQQRDSDFSNDLQGNFLVAPIAINTTLSFATPSDDVDSSPSATPLEAANSSPSAAPLKEATSSPHDAPSEDTSSSPYAATSEDTNSNLSTAPSTDTNNGFVGPDKAVHSWLLGLSILVSIVP